MKRTAEQWADWLDNDAGIYGENKRDLAALLRAMVAEREALIASHREIDAVALLDAMKARRRAEGLE